MRIRDLFFMGACLLGSCSSRPPPKPAPAVRVEVVGPGKAMGSPDTYSAVAQAKATVPLAFRGPGYVTELMQVKTPDGQTRAVGEGDRVHKGEVMARLAAQVLRQAPGLAQCVLARRRVERSGRCGVRHTCAVTERPRVRDSLHPEGGIDDHAPPLVDGPRERGHDHPPVIAVVNARAAARPPR